MSIIALLAHRVPLERRVCRLCGYSFTISLGEARSYARRGHELPAHCRHCRKVRRDIRAVRRLLFPRRGPR